MSRLLSILVLAVFLVSILPTLPAAVYAATIIPQNTKTIDGDPSDWTGTTPATDNTYTYDSGEWIWKDAANDQRTDIFGDVGDLDLVEFRVSGNNTHIFILAKFRDINKVGSYIEDSDPFGEDKAMALIVMIDDTRDGNGQYWVPAYSDTKVAYGAEWERAILITLANTGWNYNGVEIKSNYGEFKIYASNWSLIGNGSSVAVIDASNDCIEIALHVGELFGTPTLGSKFLRFTVAVIAYDWSDGKAEEVGDSTVSDVYDAVSDNEGGTNTWDEVSDQRIDFYADIWFENGEPAVPPTSLSFVAPTPADGSTLYVGETYTFKALLEVAGSPASGQAIWVYVNNANRTDLGGKTNSSGEYAFDLSVDPSMVSSLNVTVYHPGNTSIGSTEASDTRLYTVLYKSRFTSISVNASTIYLGKAFTVSGVLEYYDGSAWTTAPAGEEIEITVASTTVTVKTNSTGSFMAVLTAPTYIGTWTITITHHDNTTSGIAGNTTTTAIDTVGIRSIDGSMTDWIGLTPPRANMWNVSNNELVWRDALNDTRTDADGAYPGASTVADIEEFRVTIDEYYLYIMLKMKDIGKMGPGAPIIDIAIDRDQAGGSGTDWLPGLSDTKAAYYARWEYAIRIDLSVLSDIGTYHGSTSTWWDKPFYVINGSWSHMDSTYAWFSVDNTTDIVEVAVPWDIINGTPATGDKLRFTVITGVGDGSGNFYEISDSDALDAVTGYEPNTWDDVRDGYVDYYLTVAVASGYRLEPGDSVSLFWISPTPLNGSTVPANVPITFKVKARDSLYNLLSHYVLTVMNASSGTKIMDVEADGLGYAEFTLTLPAGVHRIKVVFNGSGLVPSGETSELVLFAEPIYPTRLNMTWTLLSDADGNGYVTPGDTVRITMTLEYYNSTEDAWHPLPNVDIRLNSTEAGVDVNVTTDPSGVAVYDWVVTDIGGPNWVKFDANYTGNATAAGTPRFEGSANHTYVPYYIARIVDGNLSDWTGTPPATTPGITTSGMEIIITDPAGDVRPDRRSDWNWPRPADLDIVETRLLIDKYEIYGAVKYVGNSSPYKILFIVIDVEPFNDSGTFWLPGYSDTMLGTISGGVMKNLSWDYVLWINPGAGYIDVYNSSYYHFYNVGGVASSDNARIVEFYARLSDFGLNGTALAGKQIRIWVIQFAENWGNIFDPTDAGISSVASDVYDVAGVSSTVGIEIWDNDGAAGNDVWPVQDHWIETGFGIAIGTDYTPSLSPTATPTSASVVVAPSKLAIGELGNVTIAVSPATTGSYVELKDHDTGDTLWTGITSFDGIAKLGVKYTVKGLHTVDVYVDGTLLTSFTVNVTGYLTKLLLDNITLTDTDSDGLPDEITVEGRLLWYNGTEWVPAVGNTTTVELVYSYYNLTATAINDLPVLVTDAAYTVNLGTAVVGTDGSFNLTTTLTLPTGYPEGGYIVRVAYAGDAQRVPAENTSLTVSSVRNFVPLYSTLPADPFTLTGTEPGLYVGDGQLLYVDPTGDYATDYLSGTQVVDLEKLWIGVRGGYLVVKADYAGDLTAVLGAKGNSAPFLVVMLDTTPSDTTDGVDSFLWLIPGYGFLYTPHTWPYPPYSHLVAGKLVAGLGSGETKYTHAIIITPVEPDNPATNYAVWLVYVENGAIVGKPIGVIRASDFANGVFIAYIPLSALGISSVQDVRLWAVSGAIYTGGTIYAREIIPSDDQDAATNGKYWHTMVYDVPGTGFLPSTADENIHAAIYNWSILVTLDPTTGFTNLYTRLVEVSLPDGVADGKLYVGPAANHSFVYRLLVSEADLPVIGVDVTLYYNTTAYTATTGAGGEAVFQFIVPGSDVGKNVTITFTASAPATLATAPSYTLRVLYATRIVNATMTWTDVNGDGMVSPSDVLEFYAKVYVYDETGNWVPKAGINVTFWIYSTPYLLGWNTTDSNGETIFTYIVTGDENLVGTHNFIVQAGDNQVAGITSTPAAGGTGLTLLMNPTPEPPILPLLLLAALLLFIIIKKRK